MSKDKEKTNNLKIVKKVLQVPEKFRETDYKNKACFSQGWKTYGCLETWELALNVINNLPPQQNTFNELILDNVNVKPYLDIEWYKESFPEYDSDLIKSCIKECLVTIFKIEFQYELNTNDIYFTQCHRITNKGYKFSFHVIISTHPSIVFFNANCASFLAKELKKLINSSYDMYSESIVDLSVYKKTQNIRLPGHCKEDEWEPMKMEKENCPLEYIITYIDRDHILLKIPEQADFLNKEIKNCNKIDITSDLEQETIEKVKLIHPSCFLDKGSGDGFIKFNYSDRAEPCFTNEKVFHDQIGFFAYIYNNDIYAGCYSGRCVNEKNKKITKIIGSLNTNKNLTFETVDFDNTFNLDHIFIKNCIFNGAIGISNLFQEMYLKPKRVKWINDSKNGSSYFWDGKLWQEDDYAFIERLLVTTIVKVLREFQKTYKSNDEIGGEETKDIIKSSTNIITRLNDGLSINNIIKFIKPLIRDTEFYKIKDIHPYFLSCKNGMVDLITGDLRASRPDDNITRSLETEYNINSDSSDFDLFVRQITSNESGEDQDLYNYFRWIIGYTIQGIPVKKIFIILYGPHGFNGKSLVMNTIKEILETYAVAMDNSVVLDNGSKKTGGSHSTELFQLEHARIGLLSDTKEDACLDDGRIKQLTGITDKISGREIFGKQKEFTPTFVPFISTNHPIQVNLNDQAMYERLILFPFVLSFVDNPTKKYERKADNNLSEKFKNNKEGILKWIINASIYYNNNKNMKIPEVINNAKQQYNKQVNIYIDFIDTTFVRTENESDRIKKDEFIDSYKIYMEQNGMKNKCKPILASREFDKLIKFITKPSKYYICIKYKDTENEVDELM